MDKRMGAVRAALVLAMTAVATSGPLLGHPAAAAPATVSEDVTATYQTNGRVNVIITVGHTIYVGGKFTTVRPAGSPPGSGAVTRLRLAAFSAVTGQLLGWNPGANSEVNALAASRDGHTIYVGGKFGRLAGHSRRNLGSVKAGSGHATAFRADTDRRVLALATAPSRVYVGGKFTRIDGKSRSRVAAVSSGGRVLRSWHPSANGFVRAIALSPDHKNVFVGGDFSKIGSKKERHLAKLDDRRGRVRRFRHHPGYSVVQLVAAGHNLFLAGNGAGGHAASYSMQGRFRWVKQTDGAVHSVAVLGGAVYVGGQFNKICVGDTGGPNSGFKCPAVLAPRQHLAALAGADGSPLSWNPGTNSIDGVFAVAAVAGTVDIGGDFTNVSGVDQEGFAGFATGS